MPNNAELTKAERILHDMKHAIWKLTSVFSEKNDKEIYDKIDQAWELLDDVDHHLRNNSELFCRWCNRPVFNPVFYKYKPYHKRCIKAVSRY